MAHFSSSLKRYDLFDCPLPYPPQPRMTETSIQGQEDAASAIVLIGTQKHTESMSYSICK